MQTLAVRFVMMAACIVYNKQGNMPWSSILARDLLSSTMMHSTHNNQSVYLRLFFPPYSLQYIQTSLVFRDGGRGMMNNESNNQLLRNEFTAAEKWVHHQRPNMCIFV